MNLSREALSLARTIAAALAIALVLRTVLVQPYTIPSASMEPTLLNSDYLVVSKFSYGWSRYSLPFAPPLFRGRLLGRDPARGDIVIFQLPRDPSQTYVKRLIGLPGDRVQVRRGVVFVNDEAIPQAVVGGAEDPDRPGVRVMQLSEAKPTGERYLTFDRSEGQEGDDTGLYRVPAGQYFFMGDNRDNCSDSRWPRDIGVGFVPAQNLVGKAEYVLASWRGFSWLRPWTAISGLRWDRLLRRLR
jgi:signal peptidase I